MRPELSNAASKFIRSLPGSGMEIIARLRWGKPVARQPGNWGILVSRQIKGPVHSEPCLDEFGDVMDSRVSTGRARFDEPAEDEWVWHDRVCLS